MKSLNAPEQTPSVLILDEDQEMRELMSTEIRGLEYTLLQAETFSHALTLLATNRVSVFILNFKIEYGNKGLLICSIFLKLERMLKNVFFNPQ